MKKKYEYVEEALKVLSAAKCSVDDELKQITHNCDCSLRVSGAIDFLRQKGYTVVGRGKPENWSIKGL